MSTFLKLQVEMVGSEERVVSAFDMMKDSNAGVGWLVNIALLAMFGYALYVFYNRFFAIKRAFREEEDFVSKIKSLLLEGNIESAQKYCSNSESPSARILEKGISRLGKPTETIAGAMENASRLEVMRLKKGMNFLAMASGVAPLLGFFGTATALFGVFWSIQTHDTLNPKEFAPGAMAALVTSIAGLIIGAGAFTGYKFLLNRVEEVTYRMENDTVEFMDLLHNPGN